MKHQHVVPFTCVCDNKRIEIPIKKPSPYRGTTLTHICPSCGSEFFIRVIKDYESGNFKIFVRNEFLSPQFNAAMAIRKNPIL